MVYKVNTEPVLFLYMLSLFMLIPAFQNLIYVKVCLESFKIGVCDNLFDPSNRDALEDVQTWSSHWILASMLVIALPSLIASQYLGSWSDMYGRKIPLFIPLIGAALSSLVYVGMSSYLYSWPVSLTLLASTISGICGGYSACMLTCFSYIAHVTEPSSRTIRLSIMESMISFGGTLGPLFTTWIQNGMGKPAPFIFIMILNTIGVIYIAIFVRNIPPRFPPPSGTWLHLWRFDHPRKSLLTIFRRRVEGRRCYILLLLLSYTLTIIIYLGEMNILLLYVKDTPIDWNLTDYTQFSSVRNFLGGFGLLVLLPMFRRFSDTLLMGVSYIFRIAFYVLLGLSKDTVSLYIAAGLWLLSMWCISTTRSAMSKLVDSDEQGKIFASIALIESCCTLIGTALFNSFYPVTLTFFKGFLFELSACLLIISFGITCFLHKHLKKFDSYQNVEDDLPEPDDSPESELPSPEKNYETSSDSPSISQEEEQILSTLPISEENRS